MRHSAQNLGRIQFGEALESSKLKIITTAAAIRIQMANRARKARQRVAERSQTEVIFVVRLIPKPGQPVGIGTSKENVVTDVAPGTVAQLDGRIEVRCQRAAGKEAAHHTSPAQRTARAHTALRLAACRGSPRAPRAVRRLATP